MKRDTLIVVGSVVLAVILVGLFVAEILNPQGGAAMLSGMMG
ncbi:MAG: hypothetical protein ACI4S2_12975 [Lachnospiraceae bacterium]